MTEGSMEHEGRIMKGIAGFYYVDDGKDIYECKARGLFRKTRVKPLPGDFVRFSVIPDTDILGGYVEELLPRKNSMIRPEAANVDQVFLVFSASSPDPNMEMLNRYLVMCAHQDIPVVLVINKCDLGQKETEEKVRRWFSGTIYPAVYISVLENRNIDALKTLMKGKVTAFAGPSGVGKSSLLNLLFGEERMETGSLSEKISRGKNTTRHTEMFRAAEDTYVFDTPGFTSVELDHIPPEELMYDFPEFAEWIPECRFSSCRHIGENGCGVRKAAEDGRIPEERYLNYTKIYKYLSTIRRY